MSYDDYDNESASRAGTRVLPSKTSTAVFQNRESVKHKETSYIQNDVITY